jgi:hypothetical protein
VSLGRRGLPRSGDAEMSRARYLLVSTACCSTVIYYFVVTKSPALSKTLLNNTCQATATANLPSSSQGCGRCGSAALPARERYGVPCKTWGGPFASEPLSNTLPVPWYLQFPCCCSWTKDDIMPALSAPTASVVPPVDHPLKCYA